MRFKLIKENGMHIGGECIEHDVAKKETFEKI
jgi:hypothetical protein